MTAFDRALRAGKGDWRNHLTSVLGTSVAFLCLAFALISSVNLDRLERRWQHVGHISAYLLPTTTDDQVRELAATLEATPGIGRVEVVSSEQARDDLLRELKDPLLGALPLAAFPSSVEITLTESARTGARGKVIASMLERMTAVQSMETYRSWAERISELVHAAGAVVWALACIVLLAVVAVVGTTTRLALHRRREEVEVLRFVGATGRYMRGPFLIEGAFQGGFGAALAVVSSAGGFALLRHAFGKELTLLFGVQPSFLPWAFILGLLGMGAGLGATAAYASLRKSFAS